MVIVTRDRRDTLRVALESALAQEGDVEVLVMDDASTDGTPDLVAGEFPAVRLVRSATARGYIAQRNAAARLARAPVIVSIDDDARFSAPDTVATTLAEFDDPRIAAVAMPFVHTARGPQVHQRAPGGPGTWLTNAYIGTAHAVRRDVFLELGGYREDLGHFFEEPDLCLRMLSAGHAVRLGRAAPILHTEFPGRDLDRAAVQLLRNHVVFAWTHVPLPDLLARALAVVAYAAWFGPDQGAPTAGLRGVAAGVRHVARERPERRPVSRADWRRWQRLRRRPRRLAQPGGASSR